ncbi:hypothetical protein CYY_000252 [Polysphondylium violaceum]|uniref:FNIP repeat-containing protein n=1 Tax=Polysphondylium violaceum TaxID=133409 RepID=A0A8J4Q484_9MYCE|nr:hypothetical protein CYY_000252 [Polysphondylium violaceum]
MATEEQKVDDDNQIDADHQLKKRKLNDGSHGKTEQEQQEEVEEITLPSALKILLPSSIQSICLDPDDDLHRSRITVIDRDDYYSTTPKIREGLRGLVLPDSFNQFIPNNTLPSTLESLSILNPQYNQPLNSNNIPTSLTSFKCMSNTCRLDLSSYDSIRELKTHGDTIINYPHYLESLEIRLEASKFKKEFNFINKHLIKRLVIDSPSQVNMNKLLDTGFPNLEYLKVKRLDPNVQSKVLTSIQELDIENVYDECDSYLSPTIKDIHLGLTSDLLELSLYVPVNNEIIEKERNNYVPNQLPMVDNFFKIWRNVYIKPIIMESFYESTRSSLRFNVHTGTLDYMDRFPNYNIFVDDEHQLIPALLQFDKAQQMTISCSWTNLSEKIPRSIQRLRCYYDPGSIIPSWITDLHILGSSDLPAVKVPPSVTRLTLSAPWQSLCEIPATVKYLSLDSVYGLQSIPSSVTHLTFLNQAINSLEEIEIPSTVQKIEFKKLSIDKSCSLNIPSSISNRLVNGVFYIYSESKNQTAIPSNATHLFWGDDNYIDNDDVNIPPSVHTLVLGDDFEAPIVSLPPTITQMVFSGELQQFLYKIYFPPSLKYLYFGSLQIDIHENDLPNGLTHLVIGNFEGQIRSLPQSCHHLEYNYERYGDDDDFIIPPQIKHLKFTTDYSITIPHTVQSVMTSSHGEIDFMDTESPLQIFNIDSIKEPSPFFSTTRIHLRAPHSNFDTFIMPNRLGNNIRSIAFGDMFNQAIVKGTFPNSIEHLDFGNKFNQKLKRSLLPTSLFTLVLGSAFNQDLNGLFPSTLTEISLNMLSKPQIKSSSEFPPNLKKLTIPCYDGVLDIVPTSTIHHLQFNNNIVQNTTESLIFPVELTPPNITTLILNDNLCIENYSIIPPTIKNIKLCLSMVPDTKIPCTIESVVLPALFNQSLFTILQTVDGNDQ